MSPKRFQTGIIGILLALIHAYASDMGIRIPDYSSVGASDSVLIVDNGVRSIGEGAFAGSAFRRATLPPTLDSIGPYAFAHCAKLEYIELPRSVKYIGRNAFSGCTSLKSVGFNDGITHIGDEAFQSTAISEADLSHCRSLSYLGGWAFTSCTELRSASLTSVQGLVLGEGIFMNCRRLSYVHAPSASLIPPYMFAESPSADIRGIVSGPVTGIGEYALSGNASTDSIVLQPLLNSIDDHAMERMTSLRHIDATGLESVPETGTDIWHGVDQPNVELAVSDEMRDIFASTPQWQEFHISRTTSSPVPSVAGNQISIRITDSSLTATSDTGQIIRLDIIGINGTILQSHESAGSSLLTTDISSAVRGVYVARVWLSDSDTRSFTFVK